MPPRKPAPKGGVSNYEDWNHNTYDVLRIQNSGWEWVEKNISQFKLREESRISKSASFGKLADLLDEDIPF
jgi:hypothetical protein